jgi:drug/metabolite transporter (DMT)-like permease
MLVGVLWALIGGLMLGLYALPGKFTKDFKEENTWGLFFMLTMFVVPLIATFVMMDGVGDIYGTEDIRNALPVMVVTSVLWGIGVMMWGKAIHHIGVSLGFSLFIGTVIFIGSILPIVIGVAKNGLSEGLPPTTTLVLILLGIGVVLLGIVFNGKAGLIREKDEVAQKTDDWESGEDEGQKKSMVAGITIAVVGGLLATGFNVANTVGNAPNKLGILNDAGDPKGIMEIAVTEAGNPGWMVALGLMLPIFLSGGVIMAGYFGWQLTSKNAWASFKTPSFPRNFGLIFIMAFFHYAASAAYAYGQSRFELGPVVVYAIFNTTCVVVAVISGIVTKEWINASSRARRTLYTGLACMVLGVGILTVSQYLKKVSDDKARAAETAVQDYDSHVRTNSTNEIGGTKA